MELEVDSHHADVEIRNATTPVWKHVLWAVVAVVFLWALAQIPNTIIVFSLAWLIAYLLNPAVDALQGKKIGPIKHCSRGGAVGIVTGLLVGLLVAAGFWAFPQLTGQVQNLIALQDSISDPMQLPVTLREKAEPFLARVPAAYRDQAMEKASELIQESASKIGTWVSKVISWLASFLGELLSGLFLVCTAFLVSLYMLLNWHGMSGAFLEKLPKQYRDEVHSLSIKMNEIFGAYLKATILTSLACMVATFLSLLILSWITGHDFPYKGLVAFVAGLAYPVPVIGIIATSILGGVLGYLPENDLGFGIAVLVTINVVNALIDRTVQPKLMSDAIGVSELFVMFAAFAGGEVAGIWGMLLGIPVAAMGKALFEWFHTNFLVVEELTPEEKRFVLGPDAPAELSDSPSVEEKPASAQKVEEAPSNTEDGAKEEPVEKTKKKKSAKNPTKKKDSKSEKKDEES
jgi:predicted PurR-regulated permease PerM